MILSIIAQLLLLASPTIVEATSDYIDFKRGKEDKKRFDVFLRSLLTISVGVAASYINGLDFNWLQGIVMSFGVFVMFFDYIMGYLLTGDPFFLGETAETDKEMTRMPEKRLLLYRGIVF